jgi:HD-GYP domain-containing protein (c-di-GMP phosphodiesterase class II)
LEAALAEVLDGAGTQFDPEIAAAFERLVRSGEISAD